MDRAAAAATDVQRTFGILLQQQQRQRQSRERGNGCAHPSSPRVCRLPFHQLLLLSLCRSFGLQCCRLHVQRHSLSKASLFICRHSHANQVNGRRVAVSQPVLLLHLPRARHHLSPLARLLVSKGKRQLLFAEATCALSLSQAPKEMQSNTMNQKRLQKEREREKRELVISGSSWHARLGQLASLARVPLPRLIDDSHALQHVPQCRCPRPLRRDTPYARSFLSTVKGERGTGREKDREKRKKVKREREGMCEQNCRAIDVAHDCASCVSCMLTRSEQSWGQPCPTPVPFRSSSGKQAVHTGCTVPRSSS